MPFGIARMNFRPSILPVGENALTPAWVAAVVTAGGTVSSGRRTLVNALFNSLDAYGLTPLLGRLWLLAAENIQAASVDLIARQQYTLVNSPTFTTDRGYAGDGTSSYINLNTATAGTQNSSMFGVGNRTNQAALNATSIGQNSGGSPSANLELKWSDGKLYHSSNDNDSEAGFTAPANPTGIYIVTRTASGTTGCTVYKDGSSLGNNGISSSAVPTGNFFVGACNNNLGTPSNFSTNQFSAAFLGSGLTAAQALNFNTTLQTYLTAVGA